MKYLKIMVVFLVLFILFGCIVKEKVFLNGDVSYIYEINIEYVD